MSRDELIGILWDNAVADRVRDGKDLKLVPVVRAKAEACADAILAAGYRKPRTITTAEELNALPSGSIILESDGNPLRAAKRSEGKNWWVDGPDALSSSALIPLPVTVLHEGSQQ